MLSTPVHATHRPAPNAYWWEPRSKYHGYKKADHLKRRRAAQGSTGDEPGKRSRAWISVQRRARFERTESHHYLHEHGVAARVNNMYMQQDHLKDVEGKLGHKIGAFYGVGGVGVTGAPTKFQIYVQCAVNGKHHYMALVWGAERDYMLTAHTSQPRATRLLSIRIRGHALYRTGWITVNNNNESLYNIKPTTSGVGYVSRHDAALVPRIYIVEMARLDLKLYPGKRSKPASSFVESTCLLN